MQAELLSRSEMVLYRRTEDFLETLVTDGQVREASEPFTVVRGQFDRVREEHSRRYDAAGQTLEYAFDPEKVLDGKRLVEVQLLPQGIYRRLVGLIAQHGPDRISGHQMHYKESEYRYCEYFLLYVNLKSQDVI